MSKENVVLAYEAFGALERRDVEGFLALVDPSVEFTSLIQEAEARVYRGHAGVRQFFDLMLSVFPDWRPTIESAEDFGDTVLVRARIRGTAATSGMEVEQTMWQLARAREGMVSGWDWYRTREEALEALRREAAEPPERPRLLDPSQKRR